MGYDNRIYVGPYVKVFLPRVDVTNTIKTCTNAVCRCHGKVNQSTPFCGACGHEIKLIPFTRKEPYNIHQMLYDRIGQDTFFVVTQEWLNSEEPEAFVILIPNRKDQGGYRIEDQDFGEFLLPIIQTAFTQGDWVKLIDVLTELNLKHVDNVGIIKYFY